MTAQVSSPRGGGRSNPAFRATWKAVAAVLTGSTAGSTCADSPCEIRKGVSSFGTSCTLISTTGSGLTLCSSVKSACSKWWRAASRCREYSKRSVTLSKARPAGVTAASCWSIRAAPSLPASFITSIIGRPVNVDSGPCAMASYLNEQVIAADLKSETRWAAYEWCPMALAHGLQACWSTPISSAVGKVLGAFALYYDKPRTPTSLEQSLIEQFTHIASIAIERVQSDAALKRSEVFLAEAQHLSSIGSFSWRVATDEISWSEQLYRIFEFDQGVRMTHQLIDSRVHPEDALMCREVIERALGDGSDVEFEHRLQMPDHSVKYLHVVAHGTRDQEGRLEYIGAIQDVTERRRAEEALGQIRSELAHVARVTSLGALTASIAHEVNQPLSGIITNASTCLRMLAADPPNVDGARETARRTIRDGNRASDVITRLRALFGKKNPTTEPVDLNDATREVIALSLSRLQRERVILRTELADDLALATGDRVQLQQVILNLVQNATDAMSAVDDRPRQLLIRTERDE